jgi:hypothetical protein
VDPSEPAGPFFTDDENDAVVASRTGLAAP